MSKSKKSVKKQYVYIVYENLRIEKGLRRAIVDVFSTRKKASDSIKDKNSKMIAIAEYEVK